MSARTRLSQGLPGFGRSYGSPLAFRSPCSLFPMEPGPSTLGIYFPLWAFGSRSQTPQGSLEGPAQRAEALNSQGLAAETGGESARAEEKRRLYPSSLFERHGPMDDIASRLSFGEFCEALRRPGLELLSPRPVSGPVLSFGNITILAHRGCQ